MEAVIDILQDLKKDGVAGELLVTLLKVSDHNFFFKNTSVLHVFICACRGLESRIPEKKLIASWTSKSRG